jgi:hypothetical protein
MPIERAGGARRPVGDGEHGQEPNADRRSPAGRLRPMAAAYEPMSSALDRQPAATLRTARRPASEPVEPGARPWSHEPGRSIAGRPVLS